MPMTDEQIDAGGTWHDRAARKQYVAAQVEIEAVVAEHMAAQRQKEAAAAAKGQAPNPFEIVAASRALQDTVRRMANAAHKIREAGWTKPA